MFKDKTKHFISVLLVFCMIFSTSYACIYAEDINISVDTASDWIGVGYTTTVTADTSPGTYTVNWVSSSPAVATVDSSGVVSGISAGYATIYATYTTGGVTYYSNDLSIQVIDFTGITDNAEYYIMSASKSKYLSLASNSTANQTSIKISEKGTSNIQKWVIKQHSMGGYTFTNRYQSAGKVMYAYSTSDVYLYTNNGSSRTLFQISRVNSGEYQGCYTITDGNKYLSCDSTEDVFLSSTLDSDCYWSFMRTSKGYGNLFSFNYTYTATENGSTVTDTYNSTANNSLFVNTFVDLGYTPSATVNSTAANAFSLLPTSDIFVFRGHGSPGLIAFYGEGQTLQGRITAASGMSPNSAFIPIDSLSANALSNARCVLYLGCNTGVTYLNQFNLVNATYSQGAHFVFGATKTIYRSINDEWLEYFLVKISQGGSVYEAIRHAKESIGTRVLNPNNDTGYYPEYYIGDSKQFLN